MNLARDCLEVMAKRKVTRTSRIAVASCTKQTSVVCQTKVPILILPKKNGFPSIHISPSFYDMMTSSNGNIFRVTGPLCGEFTGPGEFPTQRPVTRSFDVFFDLGLNKRLNKHSCGWWFETLSWSLWRHHNGYDPIAMTSVSSRYKIRHNFVRHEITYPFANFNGCIVEVWERTSNFIPYFIMDVITYSCWD